MATPTDGPKTNKQHRLNKQMGQPAAREVSVDQWIAKQHHVYQETTYTQIPLECFHTLSVKLLHPQPTRIIEMAVHLYNKMVYVNKKRISLCKP